MCNHGRVLCRHLCLTCVFSMQATVTPVQQLTFSTDAALAHEVGFVAHEDDGAVRAKVFAQVTNFLAATAEGLKVGDGENNGECVAVAGDVVTGERLHHRRDGSEVRGQTARIYIEAS